MVYPHRSFAQIAAYCRENRLQLWQYVQKMEGEAVWGALRGVWRQMNAAVDEGLAASGELPGGLQVQRKAQHLYAQHHIDETRETRENRLVCAYAFAVSEQNAAGGVIVTAPTCGSCGVLPAVLRYTQEKRGFSEEEVLHALAAAGVIGNLIRTNASISGAACGCQAAVSDGAASDRVRRRGGHRAPSGAYLRPDSRPGADSLYRTQRRGGHAGDPGGESGKFSERYAQNFV